MREIIAAILEILNESSPYLVLGFALAGVLHVVLARYPRVTAQITGPGRRPVFMAALLGAPMPLCSCSVLPAAMALRRKGASKGATASFLVSVPETDIVSVLVTLALIGPFVAVYRPLAAVMGALATGLAVRWFELRDLRAATARASAAGPSSPRAASCCENTAPVHGEAAGNPAPAVRVAPWWKRALRYGFIEIFDDIVPQLFLGIVLAGIIGVWLPDVHPGAAGGKIVSYLLMVVIGIPVYVCAAASTPIAAGLIAGGVSPGAAMVFLLAGPATNFGSLVVLRAEFGVRILGAYVAMIALTSIALGALLDLLAGPIAVRAVATAHEHGEGSAARLACTIALLAWIALSFHRSRLFPRLRGNLARMVTRASER
jgi:uncharacterized membrane protein YraQ (UPF0718 family)